MSKDQESTGLQLPFLKTNPRFIFFTDFDGTITQQDSNDFMVEQFGIGPTQRKLVFDDILFGRRSFRDGFEELLDTITLPWDECIKALLENITLDEGFREFYTWARAKNIPIVVLSGGMEPIIRALLAHLLGEDEASTLPILSNDVLARDGKTLEEGGGWKIVYRDDSSFGHDKSLAIRPYAALPEGERPVMFYAGDGVSDLSAAKETDLLFAKAGRDLVTYCENESVPYTTFQNFSEILATVKDIVSGNNSLREVSNNKI
ncbi:related to Phosphoserine phosphatase [Rhynchosporium secalis]|uniref:Related to Phosphoserine phosphatase n=1 Tax=Rhynchosporium secalis TaxID=38038 RepID=A0A1E1MT36_RHYSE|nr:related to Phosphoserine phosphatase [Rhynchosporium secalis]